MPQSSITLHSPVAEKYKLEGTMSAFASELAHSNRSELFNHIKAQPFTSNNGFIRSHI